MITEYLHSFILHMNVVIRRVSANNNLSLSQYFALSNIPTSGISMTELSKIIGIDKSTLTRIIENLEKVDLVFRKKNNKDRRSVKIYLTEQGLYQSEKYRLRLEILGKQILTNNIHNKKELKSTLENFLWELWKYNLKI